MPGGFLDSASNVRLEGTILSAHCTTKDEETKFASIDLNEWIGNNDGKLEWAIGGNFVASCTNFTLNDGGATLSCLARQVDGESRIASIDLNGRIANIDGELRFE